MTDNLTLDEYQRRAAITDVEPNSNNPLVPLLGLAGEVGAPHSRVQEAAAC